MIHEKQPCSGSALYDYALYLLTAPFSGMFFGHVALLTLPCRQKPTSAMGSLASIVGACTSIALRAYATYLASGDKGTYAAALAATSFLWTHDWLPPGVTGEGSISENVASLADGLDGAMLRDNAWVFIGQAP